MSTDAEKARIPLHHAAAPDPDVPPGYKRTEVGVIPEDWKNVRLGDVAEVIMGQSPAGNTYNKNGLGTPLINGPTEFTDKYPIKIQWTTQPTKLCKPEDLLLCVRGSSTGRINIADDEYCLGRGVAAIRGRDNSDTKFLTYQVGLGIEKILTLSAGSTFPNVDGKAIRSIEIILPPLTEQRVIAKALSDVDGLIAALDKLIAKKRAIKQAAMQQLLTGKTRLPGFSGEWETKRLGDLLAYERPDNYIVQDAEYTDQGYIPVLTANKSFILGYTNEDFGVCRDVPAIVFDDFTTDCKYVNFSFKVKSSAIKLLRARNDAVDLRYVFERMQLIRFSLGNHKRYYISEYQDIELAVPNHDEQVAIATILSDMDAEIEALEQRRDKVKQIKQGMMQQLLTGRIRLVKPKTAGTSPAAEAGVAG